MNFQDFLINTTTARSGLKPSFNTGETPTQQNFHDMIDGLFLLQDDSIYKDANNGLAIRTGANDQALLFFDHDSQDLTWSVEIDNGLHIKDKDSNARLSVLNDGKVGVGTTSPGAKLHITDFTDNNSNAGLIIGSPDTSSVGFNSGIYDHSIGNPSLVVYPTSNSAYALYAGEATGSDLFWVRGDGVGFFKESLGIGAAPGESLLKVVGKDVTGDRGVINLIGDALSLEWTENHSLDQVSYIQWLTKAGVRQGYMGWHPDYLGLGLENGFNFNITGGNVGIGTPAPEAKLHIRGFSGGNAGLVVGGPTPLWGTLYTEGKPSVVVYSQDDASTTYPFTVIGSASAGSTLFYIKANGAGYLKSSGWQYASDSRLKKDISSLEQSQVDQLLKLRGVSYEYKHQAGKQLGFIAQEMQEVFPELVSEDKEGYLSVNYTGLIPVLTEAVKDLNNKNEALEARVLHLEQLLLNANTLN